MNLLSVTAATLFAAGVVSAQTEAPGAAPKPQPEASATPAQPPASASAGEVTLTPTKIVVVAVKGNVGYHLTPDGPREIAKVGSELREGTRISLGMRSKVTIRVGDGQNLTFDQLGNLTINTAVNDGKVDITRIDVAQGRAFFDVKKVRFANDVIIRTPDMTLAIRGTTGMIEHTPGRATLATGDISNTGLIVLDHRLTGRRVQMTGNERSNTAIPDPAMNLHVNAIVDTATDAARERDEVKIIKRGAEGNSQSIQLDLGDRQGKPSIDLTPVMSQIKKKTT